MNPKMFISYSWGSPDHETWVLDFATELRENAVDVILDKWDLKEGQNAHLFMERMVNDPDVKKVAIICDENYTKKANNRSGGVGTETQIITPEIYTFQDQSKFVAIIRERDDNGAPYLPTYLKTRIYIDLSDVASYAENFEQLLRWVYDQPVHKKPELGKKPVFLSGPEQVSLSTASRFRRAAEGLRSGRDYALPALEDYFNTFASELEKFRISTKEEDFPNQVLNSIKSFTPYRNEVISLFTLIAMYKDDGSTNRLIVRFFEKLIPYLDRPAHVNQWSKWDFDNFKFIVNELFLYLIACFVKNERFETVSNIIGIEYYVAQNEDYGQEVMVPFGIFGTFAQSIHAKNERSNPKYLSPQGHLLKERCNDTGIGFRDLMCADFILYLRGEMIRDEKYFPIWWPHTLVYVGHFARSFEMFSRSKSLTFFNQTKTTLGVKSKEELVSLIEKIEKNPQSIPKWEFDSFNPRILLGLDNIATRP